MKREDRFDLPVHDLKDDVVQLIIWTTKVPEETFRIITEGCFILLSCRQQNTMNFIQEVGRVKFAQWYLDKKDELESVRNDWPFRLRDTHLMGGVIQDFATLYLIYHIDWIATTALCYEIYYLEFKKFFFVRKEVSILYPLSERHYDKVPPSQYVKSLMKSTKHQIVRCRTLIQV